MSMEVYAMRDKKGAYCAQSLIKIIQCFHSTVAFHVELEENKSPTNFKHLYIRRIDRKTSVQSTEIASANSVLRMYNISSCLFCQIRVFLSA